MARVIFNESPGTVWTNTTGRVQFQMFCNWHNTCGLCAQYDHAIGPSWPIPFHRGCRCTQAPVVPGEAAHPFVDFRSVIRTLPRSQQTAIMGRANFQLVERGVVAWGEVVTNTRVRTLQEVVSRNGLTVRRMTAAGVNPRIATVASTSVNTPAHVLAERQRAELVGRLQAAGQTEAQVQQAVAGRLAERVGIAGPSGSQRVIMTSADYARRAGSWTFPADGPAVFVPRAARGMAAPSPSAVTLPVSSPAPAPAQRAMQSAAPRPVPRPEPTLAAAPARPRGERPRPVSAALQVELAGDPSYRQVRQDVTDALVQIDRVHSDGALPTIQVRPQADGSNALGTYMRRGQFAQQIMMAPRGSTQGISMIHEAGHFIEHAGIPGHPSAPSLPIPGAPHRDFASDPLFQQWNTAVRNSDAIRHNTELVGQAETLVAGHGLVPVDQTYLQYLNREREVWARSYAQWVVTRSGNADLINQLGREQAASNQVFAFQWTDEDFVPIGNAIDEMFRGLGWLPPATP